MARAINFSAGPAVLPLEVLKEAKEAAYDYQGKGISVMEMSHRSKEYDEIFTEAQADCLEIMGLSADEYAVLFLGGGASLQFHMVAMNFLKNQADYINTGAWSKKAIKEAKWFGKTNVIASSENKIFNYIPDDFQITPGTDYLHITTNNTIYGTEWKDNIPDTGSVPLIADMSSDMFAIQRDWSKYDMIYAGAQKNIGPAGATLVVIRKSWLEKSQNDNIPTMLDYKIHVDKNSLFNTPPAYPVYVIGRTFKWILRQGGLGKIQQNNEKKAALLYDFIDVNGFYKSTVPNKRDRSLMNVTWNLQTSELETKFIEQALERYQMKNLKGHRSVGGIRASIYNACPIEWVETLVKFMDEFMKENQ
jgi:phosphoserine aminotransferase